LILSAEDGSFEKDETPMTILGSIFLWIGLMIWLFGEVRFLVVAYHSSMVWYFGCLFVPLAGLAFFLFNFKKTWRPMMLSTVGFLIAVVGCWAGGF
jgi:hypothetical protein